MSDDHRSPIPEAHKDDAEDVSWALSTAEAMWKRGDYAEAIKWVYRAAESASEAENDDRALELAKAAADLKSLAPAGSLPLTAPPPAVAAVPAAGYPTSAPPAAGPAFTPQPAVMLAPGVGGPPPIPRSIPSRPPPPLTPSRPPPPVTAKPPPVVPAPSPSSPAPRPNLTAARPIPAVRPAAGRPASMPPPPRVVAGAPKPSMTGKPDTLLPRPAAGKPLAPMRPIETPKPAEVAPVSRRGSRRSSSNLSKDKEVTVTVTQEMQDTLRAAAAGVGNNGPETKKRSRSRPSPEDTLQGNAMDERVTTLPATTDEMDAWPTASLSGEELDDGEERTRIGAIAFQPDEAVKTPESVKPPPSKLRTTQAVRVIVWRAADGVHVAPVGTQVSAIAVEAVLVGLEPGTDLAAWFDSE